MLDSIGTRLVRWGVRANQLTAIGWLVGVGACVAVGFRLWMLALASWLLNRLFDGLDGAVARRRGASEFGAYFDLVADFSIYAGFVGALALTRPDTRVASVVLLCTYYVSAVALLGGAALLDRRNVVRGDDRGVRFLGGLAEGFETIVAYGVILLAPSRAVEVEWIFAVMVLVTALQRLQYVRHALRAIPASEGAFSRPGALAP